MVNKTMLVRNGAIIMINRGHKATPDYEIPSRFKVSIDTPDVTWTDTTLTTEIPISGTETASDCSVITSWTASGTNSVTANSTTFKPDGGTDGALNVVKSDTSSATFTVSKTVTSLVGTSKDLTFWLYIKDATALAKFVSSGDALSIRYGSDSSNYYEKTYEDGDLSTGWNFFKIAITSGFDTTTGSPVIGALDYFYLEIVTNNASDTFAAGDVIYDAIRLAEAADYYKSIESDPVFDETDVSVTLISKLSVTEANGFLLDGHALFNADGTEKLSNKSKFNDASKGTTDLFKFTSKIKLRNLNQT